MILLFAAGCLHTPPHEPLPEPVTVRLAARHDVADGEGRDCAWEEEGLWVGEHRVFGADPPDDTDWCRSPSDHWATIDVLGQDGRYVSLLTASDAAKESCRTWDVVDGRPITLAEYDEKAAPKRVRRASRLLGRTPIAAPFDPDAFRVRSGHVTFCLYDAAGVRHELDVP